MAGLAAQKDSGPEPLFSQIDGISRDLETITGLRFKKPVPYAQLDKKQLREFLSHRIDKALKPADLKAETLVLRMLGLIPKDFDLRQETVDLMTEQAAAFYDYQKKKLFLIAGGGEAGGGDSSVMALAHELAHALADQNFHLEKYIKQNNQSDDAATARMAVMEGQATWLMSAYLHQKAGLGSDIPKPILDMMGDSLDSGAAQYPVFSQSPLYIRDSLIFPYKAGLLFQDALFRKEGKQAFAQVFLRAPISTQQIMHPERYLERLDPVLPGVPRIPREKEYRRLAEGTLGEFDYRVLLTQYADKELGEQLSGALAGSQFALLEHKRDHAPLLAWASQWQTEAKARQFFDFYRGALARKSKPVETGADSPGLLQGRNEYGYYRVTWAGAKIESIEGLKSPLN